VQVADLQYASPATISRCGMVYVDSRNLGYKPYIWRWLNTRQDPVEADALRQLFDKYASPAVDWVTQGLDGEEIVRRPKQAVPATNLNMVAQLCGLLEGLLAQQPQLGSDPVQLEALFLYCLVWSCGAALVQQPGAPDRDRFDAFLKNLAGMGTVDGDRASATQLPGRSIYEYCFDIGALLLCCVHCAGKDGACAEQHVDDFGFAALWAYPLA
jgi:dynein heavy chain